MVRESSNISPDPSSGPFYVVPPTPLIMNHDEATRRSSPVPVTFTRVVYSFNLSFCTQWVVLYVLMYL